MSILQIAKNATGWLILALLPPVLFHLFPPNNLKVFKTGENDVILQSMGRLLLYNPENDTALASGLRNFTPGREPLTLAHDGGLLAFWWANDGDRVCTVPGH